ncbi:MAG TPA: protein kinase family protein [Actinospica sp.]|nr:protein kinase family protein [Actinospica sp.]
MAALADTPDEHSEEQTPTGPELTADTPRELAAAGRRLGDRYRLERRLRGFGGDVQPEPQLWLGVDELLNRKVGVDLIATGHPLAEQVARAARDAAAVADARFVQVLDAVQDEDVLYIITEWVPGAEQLQNRLAAGPLSPARATAMVRELAEAMVRAHEAEVPHGAINPATVLITAANQVKLRGLLVEATLGGAEPEKVDPGQRYAADVLALGQVWYAALTTRWPGAEGAYGLEAAPREDTVPYTPAQIRAAVPKQMDAAVCRALGIGEQEAIGSIKELADVLHALPRMREEAPDPTTVLPPRTRSARPVAQLPADAPPTGSWAKTIATARPPLRRRRGLIAVAGCAVVALATLAAFQLSGNNGTGQTEGGSVAGGTPRPSSGGTVNPPQGSTGGPLTISGATVWDESPSSASINAAPSAFDPGSANGWQTTTQKKSASFSGTYSGGSGIGLIFDLGRTHTLDEVKFRVGASGATVEVLTGTSSASGSPQWTASAGPSGYTVQKSEQNVSSGGDVTVQLNQVSTQYVIILFTAMPYQNGDDSTGTPAGYRDNLIDVRAYGV